MLRERGSEKPSTSGKDREPNAVTYPLPREYFGGMGLVTCPHYVTL